MSNSPDVEAQIDDDGVDAVARKRNYTEWPSKNKFACKGRLIHGPDRYYFWASAGGLIVCPILFLALVAPDLVNVYPPRWNAAFIPIFVIFWIYSVTFQMLTAYSDPGILKRQPKPKPPGSDDDDDPFLTTLYSPPASKNITVQGVLLTVKWCATCNLYRPPRATHCGICDNCVSRFDHHCPYVGNCVGLRNYRYFLIFIFSTFFLVAFGLAHCTALIVLKSLKYGFSDAYYNNPVSFVGAFIVGFIALIATIMVAVLVIFTSYMVTTGRTTNENIKTLFAHSYNPWDDGCPKNWYRVCCPPTYPATVFPREYV